MTLNIHFGIERLNDLSGRFLIGSSVAIYQPFKIKNMTEFERRNATYDAFVKMMAWVKENSKGLWDDKQTFCVSNKDGYLDWELNIDENGNVYLRRNTTNHRDFIRVTEDGFTCDGNIWSWDADKACWVTNGIIRPLSYDMSKYAIDGMFGMFNVWGRIKEWIGNRKKRCDAVLNFKL